MSKTIAGTGIEAVPLFSPRLTELLDSMFKGEAPNAGRFCGNCYTPLDAQRASCPHCGRSTAERPPVDAVPRDVLQMFKDLRRRESMVVHSFAYAGLAVAALAGVFSVVVLPAIVALLGHRVNALTLWRRSISPPEEGVWHRIATVVMRRPVPVATAVVAFLLVLGAPFLGLHLTQPDDRVLPPGSDGRAVGDVLRDEFDSAEAGALSVVTEDATPLPTADTSRLCGASSFFTAFGSSASGSGGNNSIAS